MFSKPPSLCPHKVNLGSNNPYTHIKRVNLCKGKFRVKSCSSRPKIFMSKGNKCKSLCPRAVGPTPFCLGETGSKPLCLGALGAKSLCPRSTNSTSFQPICCLSVAYGWTVSRLSRSESSLWAKVTYSGKKSNSI